MSEVDNELVGTLSGASTLAGTLTIPERLTIQANKNITPTDSQQEVGPDTGYDAMAQVTVGAAPASVKSWLEGADASATVDGTTLTAKGDLALSLPNVTSIGDNYFKYMPLKSISAPELLTIGANAFEGATVKANTSFPKVTSVGASAFYKADFTGFDVSFGALVTLDTADVFASVTAKDFSFPVLTSLTKKVFNGVSANNMDLRSVTTLAGYGSNSSPLNGLTVTGKLDLRSFVGTDNTDATSGSTAGYNVAYGTKMGSADFSSLKYANCEDFRNTDCDEVHFPALEIAGYRSFNATKIKKLYFDKITAIKTQAFNTTFLTDLYIGSQAVPTIASSVFGTLPSGFKIHVPASMLASYQADSGWSAYSSYLVGDYEPEV